jgi:hypothetical protein
VVDAFCKQFNRILGSRADASIKEAWELEKLIHEQCTPQTYQALAAPVLQRLCKTSPLMDSKELDRQFLLTGKHSIPGANVSTVSIDEGKLFAMLLTAEQLAELEYPLIDARAIPDYATQRPITRDCERCGKVFLPASCQSSDECCIFHWGKLNRDQLNGQQLKVYRCCGAGKIKYMHRA